MSNSAECIFCRIANGAVPAEVVYQDDVIVAFLDIHPVKPGHMLIIPKEHHPSFLETPDATLAHIVIKAKPIIAALKSAMNASYVSVSVVGIDVPHLHVHLIPRTMDDGLPHFLQPSSYAEGEAQKVAVRIREAL